MNDSFKRNPFILESGKSLISISNIIITQGVIIFVYSFLLFTFLSSWVYEDVILLNILVSLVLFLLTVKIVLLIRETGKNLINSVSSELGGNLNNDVKNKDGSYLWENVYPKQISISQRKKRNNDQR